MDRSIVRMVLIETSWNVKNRMRITADKITPVLIETSWNVKTNTELLQQKQRARINRNIVECKVALSMLPAKAPAY